MKKYEYLYEEIDNLILTNEEDEEPIPITLDDWMTYNGLSWSDFI